MDGGMIIPYIIIGIICYGGSLGLAYYLFDERDIRWKVLCCYLFILLFIWEIIEAPVYGIWITIHRFTHQVQTNWKDCFYWRKHELNH